MYVRPLDYIYAAINTLCLNEKSQLRFISYSISFYWMYSEGNCSSQGKLTDIIKFHLPFH